MDRAALSLPTFCVLNTNCAGDSVTSGPVAPVPDNATVCGLPDASSVMAICPVRVPVVVGVNVTAIVQLAPATTLVPQLFVSAKSPLTSIRATFSVRPPEFVSATVCAGLVVFGSCAPKLREAGARVTAGAMPVPVNCIICGLPLALSVNVSVPVRMPSAVGLKVTEAEHAPPAGIEPLQVSVAVKSPETAMLLMVSGAVPRFCTLIGCGLLLVPTGWLGLGNEIPIGPKPKAGAEVDRSMAASTGWYLKVVT